MCYPPNYTNGEKNSNTNGNVVKNSEFKYTINECYKDKKKCEELVKEFLDYFKRG